MSQCNCPICSGCVPSVAEQLIGVNRLMVACDHGVKEANQFLQQLNMRLNERQHADFLQQCEIARQFAALSPGLQFRAIIEDWSETTILYMCKTSEPWGQ